MSRMTGTSYSITSPSRTCVWSHAEIKTGEAFIACLAQSLETEEFVRLDYLPESWEIVEREARAGGRVLSRPRVGAEVGSEVGLERDQPVEPERLMILGHWRARMPEPGAKPRLLIDDASLTDLFEQTAHATAAHPTPEREAFLFVLALILIRKRLLVVERSTLRAMHVRPKGPKPEPTVLESVLIEVRDPGLDDSTVKHVAEQLDAIMSGSPHLTPPISSHSPSTPKSARA